MELPNLLTPEAIETFVLADGRRIDVPKATPVFPRWGGALAGNTFGNKPVLDHCGEPCFAELVILRLFLAAGWDARWIETYGAAKMQPRCLLSRTWEGLKRRSHHPIVSQFVLSALDAVARANGNRYAGCWDVVAWRGSRIVFAESKLRKRDRLRRTQHRWLAAAIETGLSPSQFLVVEWSVG